jgi:hypothetical protein
MSFFLGVKASIFGLGEQRNTQIGFENFKGGNGFAQTK